MYDNEPDEIICRHRCHRSRCKPYRLLAGNRRDTDRSDILGLTDDQFGRDARTCSDGQFG